MKPVLIQPSDTFFFRDSIPMSAGQGRGAGARLPLPTTLHEAIRASLFEKHGRSDPDGSKFRKPRTDKKMRLADAEKYHSKGSIDFQSLQVVGPLPWLAPGDAQPGGLLFPLPLDLVWGEDRRAHLLNLLSLPARQRSSELPALTVSPVPASKTQPSGFLTADQMQRYLQGELGGLTGTLRDDGQSVFPIVKHTDLFEPEYRIGVSLDPATTSALDGQLYAATHGRPDERFRLAAWLGLKRPRPDEEEKLSRLDFLLLGGERRIARLWRDPADLAIPVRPAAPDGDGPVLLKWVLATPAVFTGGSLPGWCIDTSSRNRPRGEVCLKLDEGRARLVAACLGKPVAFAGWDTVENRSKPTRLAVPAGSAYHFLCENAATAAALADKLHWQPRSDQYGEKGCGYGLVSFDARFHPTSPDIRQLASNLF
jgi:CRISPR type III-B/RAMP module-associated protein Cmr3